MSTDRWIYYDFSTETELKEWQNIVRKENSFSFDVSFDCKEDGEYILILTQTNSLIDEKYPALTSVCIQDKTYNCPSDTVPYFTGTNGSRNGIFLTLQKGKYLIHAEGKNLAEKLEEFVKISLIKSPFSKVEKVTASPAYYTIKDIPEKYKETEKSIDLSSFAPGIGCTEIPGRFGFVKGDGVLDFSMLTLGTVTKMYMTGHPEYKKPFYWHYSVFPEGENSYHGTVPPARTNIKEDEVKINHLCSTWKSSFNGKNFSCTYSLATPALLTEYDGKEMCISDLEYAGNYQYAMLCRKGGVIEVCSLKDLSIEDMEENYILLFGTTEFPDLPLLLVFQKKPGKFTVKYDEKTNRLSSILIENCPLLFTATPYGIESFAPIRPDDEKFIRKSAELCRFWSRAFLAYPVKMEEYYKHDEENKKTTIVQKFSYRYIKDDWGTVPLELAPIPPVAQLSGLMETEENTDFAFPTQFGPLKGWIGSYSSYTLPWMPCERKFPLKNTNSKLPELLKEGYDEYFNFVSSFPPPAQSYPYAGAFLEPYAFASALTNFLSEEDQKKLRDNLFRALSFICDEEATGDYKVIDWGEIMGKNPENEELLSIYSRPEMRRLALKLWNTRKEPFTGKEYTICYLNLGYFSFGILKTGTREEIKNLAIPLIENDWGLGLTFYYIYLATLACGDLTPVKKNFAVLKSAFHFFEMFHDWACMGSGYSENGVTWCEGANYGAFTAFTQLCELLEEKESLSFARYYSSKQFALRMGIFRASRYYFYKYFGIPPYDICQSFREGNQIYGQYLCAPKDVKEDGYRPHTLYKMSTEGVYGELFSGAGKFFPEDWKRVRTLVGKDLHELQEGTKGTWGILEPAAVYLMMLALDEDVAPETFEKELAYIKERGFLMQRWRGIHIFSRRLPQNAWETQVRAWNEMKQHPMWLTLWKNVYIRSAEWTGKEAEIHVEVTTENAFIRIGYREKPLAVLLDGKEVAFICNEKEKTMEIPLYKGAGVILCKYSR